MRDIDMIGQNWSIIPTFSGTFDGCGYEIKNFCLYGERDNIAMITNLKDGKICNLRMTDGIVRTTGANTAAVFAAYTSGEAYFENVYSRMHVATDATHYRAGGFVGYTKAGTTYFDRCVSDCTFEGMRAGGFIAQINNGMKVVMTDCAFVGDMSAAGKWSGGLSGLSVGHLEMTRCVSLGKPSTNVESGTLAFLDHQNQNTEFVADVKITDCFAAVDTTAAIGAQSTRSFRFNLTLGYTDGESVSLTTDANNTIAANLSKIEGVFGYLAKGSNVYLTKDSFSTLCPQLVDWTVANDMVDYAEGKSVIKILPCGLNDLITGNATQVLPEEICEYCGGNRSLGVNYGDGTHTVLCDRCRTVLYVSHTFVDGICSCGQHENKFLLLDFLPTSDKINDEDWVTTNVTTGVATAQVDTSGIGTMSGSMQYRDAYVYTKNKLAQGYVIQPGDIAQLRIKAEITTGSTAKTAIYLTTSGNPNYKEENQLAVVPNFNGTYQTIDLGSLDAFAGQTLENLRFDIFQHGSTDVVGTYSIDYLYIGPTENAPARSNKNLFFDFNDDASAARRYSTSVYGGYNYDTAANWINNHSSPIEINNADGTMQFQISDSNVITALEAVGEDKTFKWGTEASGLSKNLYYDPSNAEIIQIRMKLDGVSHYEASSNANQYFRFYYHPVGADLWSSAGAPNDWRETSLLTAIDAKYLKGGECEGEYFTLTISLKGSKFVTYEAIDGIMLNFFALSGGTATVDYFYVGPAQTDRLLFDFENDEAADRRYDNISYRDYNFDSAQHWLTSTDVSELVISDGEAQLTVGESASNAHNQYIETQGNSDVNPLSYTPKAGDIILVRYKVSDYNADLNAGAVPTLTVYGWDNFSTSYQGTSWNKMDTSGEYAFECWNVPSKWPSYQMTRLRLTTRDFLDSTIDVDYIYVGPKESAPHQPYCVTFMNESQTHCVKTSYGDAVTCEEPTKAYDETQHYTFNGWVDKNGNAAKLDDITSDMTVYATFIAAEHDYTYNDALDGTHQGACACGNTTVQKHIWDDGMIQVTQSCTQDGKMLYNCTICAAQKTESIQAYGHTVVVDSAVAPTCTLTGLTEGEHCSTCSEVLLA